VKHPTRNKSDIALREKELHFMMRVMDKERREYGITSDLALQVVSFEICSVRGI
jgi:hypothetical protein